MTTCHNIKKILSTNKLKSLATHNRKLAQISLLACFGLGSLSSFAQTENATEEIIVTSSRIPTPLRQIGTSVSVLDEIDIQSRGNVSITDILRQMPATGSSSNGGIGKTTNVRIRGEEGFRTLTILDGIRLQDPSATQMMASFENLLSDGIGRIEVLRGPQGLAYGADAGGVINISSRVIEDSFSVGADAQAGRYGTSQLAGNIGGSGEILDYSLAVTDFETDGFNTRDSDSTLADDDGYANTSFHGRVGFKLGDGLRLEAVHRNVEGENEFDGCFSGGRVDDCSSNYDLQASRLALTYASDAFTHSLSYNKTDTERESFALGQSTFTADGELERWEYLGSASQFSGFNLVFGADQEKASNNGVSRDNTGFFLEYLSDFSDSFFLTAGARHDDNDDFGTNTSYRISGAYLFEVSSGTIKLKTAFGSGFRAPSPSEIAYNAGPFAFPPASALNLLQEESEGWEVGIEYQGSNLRMEAVYFDQDVENAIFFDLAGFSGYLQDVGSSASQGIELSADYSVTENLALFGNYTYNDTERPDGTQRLRRPENLFNFGFRYTAMNNKLNVNGFYRSQADSIDVGNQAIEDFGVFDFTASYQLTDMLRVYGRIENVFDEEYQEVIDYNSSGSAAFIGVNYSFRR